MNSFIDNILSYNAKDRLFRFIFGSEERKKWTLSLYNAIYNTDYTNADDLTLTTINDGIYMSMKNDLSFLYADTMTLIEHQSLPGSNNHKDAFLHGPDLQQLSERHKSDNGFFMFVYYYVFMNQGKTIPSDCHTKDEMRNRAKKNNYGH